MSRYEVGRDLRPIYSRRHYKSKGITLSRKQLLELGGAPLVLLSTLVAVSAYEYAVENFGPLLKPLLGSDNYLLERYRVYVDQSPQAIQQPLTVSILLRMVRS